MEETANFLNTNRRRLLAAGAAALALCALGGLWLVRPRAAEEPPLRREYPVSRQDITVGVDAAGSIQSRQWSQFAPVAVKLKEYRVNLGDQVAEGDVLAEYDLEDLQRLARESEARLAEKQSALDKLDQQKKDEAAQLQQKIDQLRAAGSESESNGLNALEQQKKELQAQVEQQRQAEQTALEEKAALLEKHSQRAQVIADCDNRLAQLEEQRAELQKALDDLLGQDAPEEQELPEQPRGDRDVLRPGERGGRQRTDAGSGQDARHGRGRQRPGRRGRRDARCAHDPRHRGGRRHGRPGGRRGTHRAGIHLFTAGFPGGGAAAGQGRLGRTLFRRGCIRLLPARSKIFRLLPSLRFSFFPGEIKRFFRRADFEIHRAIGGLHRLCLRRLFTARCILLRRFLMLFFSGFLESGFARLCLHKVQPHIIEDPVDLGCIIGKHLLQRSI